MIARSASPRRACPKPKPEAGVIRCRRPPCRMPPCRTPFSYPAQGHSVTSSGSLRFGVTHAKKNPHQASVPSLDSAWEFWFSRRSCSCFLSIQKSSDWDMKFEVGQETQNSSLATRNTTFSSMHNLCSLSETQRSYGWAIAVLSPLLQIILALPPHKQRGCAGVFQGFFLMHCLGKTIPPTEASCPSVLDLLIVAI
jgi:hypothetical protein